MQNGDRQNGDRLPVVRAARNPSNQPILVFDTDVGNGEDDRLLAGGESGFGEPPSGISLSAPADGDKCGTDAQQAGHIAHFVFLSTPSRKFQDRDASPLSIAQARSC